VFSFVAVPPQSLPLSPPHLKMHLLKPFCYRFWGLEHGLLWQGGLPFNLLQNLFHPLTMLLAYGYQDKTKEMWNL
jgi:hypothetical protein